MKKVLGIILVVIVLSAACFSVWYLTPLSSAPVGKVLPENPLLYIQFSDANKHWDNFQESKFGSEISKINFNPLVRNNQVLNSITQGFKTLRDHLNTPDAKEYASKFLGQEVTIAVYPNNSSDATVSPDGSSTNLGNQEWPEVFWVSRVPSDIKIKELLMRFFPKKTSEFNLQKIVYRGQAIYLWPVPEAGMTVAFVRIGDLFVAGLNENTVRRAIEISQKTRPSLLEDEKFRASWKTINPLNSAVSFYWNTPEVLSIVSKLVDPLRADARADEALNNFRGLTIGGISAAWDHGFKIKNEMYFNQGELSSDVKSYIETCKPGKNESLFMIPKDVLLYHSLSCLNFSQYWGKIKMEVTSLEQQEGGASSAQNAIQGFQASLGLNIERDLIPVLGSELGWFANAGIQTIPLIDIKVPQVAVFLRINDLDKAKKVMAVLFGKIPLPSKRQIVQGGEVVFIETPLGPAVEPAYMFLGDYLVVGMNLDILKEASYASGNARVSLASNESFQEVVQSVGEDYQVGVFYLKLGELLERYSGLIDMGYKWFSAQNQAKQAQLDALPLADMDQKIVSLDSKLALAQKNIADLDREIWDMGLKGEDATEKNQRKKELQALIVSLEEEISQAKSRRMEEVQKNVSTPKIDQTAAVWRNVVEPTLEAMKHVEVIGASSNILQDHFSTSIQIQMDE